MANRLKQTRGDKSAAALYWASVALVILGAADAAYLLIYKLTGNTRMCLGSGGCHDVNFSPYSEIYGIPISLLGLLGLLAMLGVLLAERRLEVASEQGPLALFGMALVGAAYSTYLTYLEIYVIRAVCPFCVASALIFLLIFVLAIIRLVKQTAS
jgi:uncharacterized membrane protein